MATTILSDVGHVANLVEHIAGREEEDRANDKETPNRTVAEEDVEVGPEGINAGANSKHADYGHNHFNPVCGSREVGVRAARGMANNPLAKGLSARSTAMYVRIYRKSKGVLGGQDEPRVEVEAQRFRVRDRKLASGRLEEKKNRRSLETELRLFEAMVSINFTAS